MRFLVIIACLLMLAGCEPIVRTQDKLKEEATKEKNEVRKLDNSFKINGNVEIPTLGKIPITFKVDQREAEETISTEEYRKIKESEKDTTMPAVEQGFSWLAGIASLLIGSGVGGFIMNVIKNGTLQKIITGIESFKKTTDEQTVEKLHQSLSKNLTNKDKELVRRIKWKNKD